MPFNFKVTNHTTATATHLFIDCLSLTFCFTSKILSLLHTLSTWPSISKSRESSVRLELAAAAALIRSFHPQRSALSAASEVAADGVFTLPTWKPFL